MQEMTETDRLALECQKLAPQVLALCDILRPQGVRTYPWGKDPRFQVVDFGDREPSETLYVSERGGVVRHTCEYSGHNGDSYGDEERALPAQECRDRLRGLHARLTEMAVKAELDRIKRREDERRLEEAKYLVSCRLARKLGQDVE